MLKINIIPPPANLLAELGYDPKTGLFRWLVAKRGRLPGRPAGSLDASGYVAITFQGRTYRAHRIAWWIQTKEWTDELIDHRNGRAADNRFSNLRKATPGQNSTNRKLPVTNTNGYRGVRLHPRSQRWNAQIGDGDRKIWLGSFATAEDAARAYDDAAIRMKGEFARLNFPVASRKRATAGAEVEGRLLRTTYRKKKRHSVPHLDGVAQAKAA